MSKRNRTKYPGDGAVAMETGIVGGAPYGTARRERSRALAQKRRTTYKGIMDELTQVLPFPNEVVSQLDYNSRLRLSLCFFRLKTLMAAGKEGPADESGGMSEVSSVDTRSSRGGSSSSEVSEHKLLQPGMLQSMMTEALDGFLMVVSSDGNIVYLSESIHHHLGIFQSEHIGVSIYDIINTDDHDAVKNCLSDVVARAMSFSIKRSNQVEFFCRMKCSRFKVATTITKTPGFKLVHISGTMKMMNNRCYLVTVVRPVSPPSISEIRMEGNMFVTHYSMDMKCTFYDGRLRHLLGYTKLDLEGDCGFNLHHHEDCDATEQCSQTLTSRGEVLSCYYRFLSQLGFYVWLQTRGTVMYDSRTERPSYIVCLNYIISKETGEKDFTLRHAITTSGSGIAEDSSHSYDPFPVSHREDGVILNPLQEPEDVLPTGRIKQESNVEFKREYGSSHSIPNCGFDSSSCTPTSSLKYTSKSSLSSGSLSAATSPTSTSPTSTSHASTSPTSTSHASTSHASTSDSNDPSVPDSTTSLVSDASVPNTSCLTSHRKICRHCVSKAARKGFSPVLSPGHPPPTPSPGGSHTPGSNYSFSVIGPEHAPSTTSGPGLGLLPVSSSDRLSSYSSMQMLERRYSASESSFITSSEHSSILPPSSGPEFLITNQHPPTSGAEFGTSESSLITSNGHSSVLPSSFTSGPGLHIAESSPNRHPSFTSESSTSSGSALGHSISHDHTMPIEQGRKFQMFYPMPENRSYQLFADSDASMLVEREWMADNAVMTQSQGSHTRRCGEGSGRVWQTPSNDTPLLEGVPQATIPQATIPQATIPQATTTATQMQTNQQKHSPNGSDPLQNSAHHQSVWDSDSTLQKDGTTLPQLSGEDLQFLDFFR